MKIKLLFILWTMICPEVLMAQATYTITVVGFTFNPSELTVHPGDTVKFDGSDAHPIQEVSEDTWNANGTTPLPGGFAFPAGVGKITFPSAGTHYYVCTQHVASEGMKGMITVSTATGLSTAQGSDKIILYPDPVTGDEIDLYTPDLNHSMIRVQIYTINGMLMINKTVPCSGGHCYISCGVLPKGAYLLKMNTASFSAVGKIIRQ